MTVAEPGAGGANIVERAKAILLTPKEEWVVIAAEPASVQRLYLGYAAPLLALSAICGVVGVSVFGYGAFGLHVRVPIVAALVSGILQVGLGLVGVYVLALIVNALAPSFGSRQDQLQAHKLAVYGGTAGFLAGVFAIHPLLAIFGLLGLYSFVLFYLGLPRIMGTPEDKRIGYLVTVIVLAIIVNVIVGAVSSAAIGLAGGRGLLGGGLFSQAGPAAQSQDVTVTLPGGVTVNTAEMEAAAKQAEAAAAAIAGGSTTPGAAVDPSTLQALLPGSLPGGFQRTSVSSSAAMGMAQAEGIYENGDARITMTIMHMGSMAGLGGLSVGMGVTGNREDADGYDRIRTENGRTITESMSRSAGSAHYGVMTANGVAVQLEGYGVNPAQLQAAANTVALDQVERLGR